MRMKYERLCKKKGSKKNPPTGADIATAYCGNQHTMEQTAQTAKGLPMTFREAIGDIMISEHPNIVQKLKCLASMSIEDLLSYTDCRMFRNFVTLNALKPTSVFMSGKGEDSIQFQIHTLDLRNYIGAKNNLRSILMEIRVQFKLSRDDFKESEKFKLFMESDGPKNFSLPTKLSSVLQNSINNAFKAA